MVLCSDKVKVRDFVLEKIGEEYLIPVLYTGESISADQLCALGNDIVAKASHDSNSYEIIRHNTPEVAKAATGRLQAKLKTDYGKEGNQFLYSLIQPQIIVEKMLIEKEKVTPDDFKIFCFRQADGSVKMLIELHENRQQPDYRVAWYDEDLESILLRGDLYEARPFPCPDRWPRMQKIAQSLSEGFDHVRIDLYYVNEQIYFGEMTFLDGGGRTEYSRFGGGKHDFDHELGSLWR